MVFSSIPLYHLDPPNWQQQNQQEGSSGENTHLPLPPPPPNAGVGSGSIRPGSMADRARVAKLPQPESALNCPRCDSTNTKFCYFNNYSQSQPRHFCKTCRRYWTRGGALRNVPVGGGCRRNKRSKGRRSKSPATTCHSGSTTSGGNNSDTIPILPPPPLPPYLPLFPNLNHLSQYGGGSNTNFSFGGFQPPHVAVSGGADVGFQIGGSGSILSSGLGEQWRVQQFPFLSNLEPPNGLYPFDGEGVQSSKALETGISRMATVKMEENGGLNLSRNLLGIQGNDQYWGANTAWTDLSTSFATSSSNSLL